MFKIVLIAILAGLGAGLGTGLAGMSAAAVIAPMLIAFLDVEPFTAVGIALASDVLASAVSALTYAKNKNIDVKNSWILLVTVLVFTVIGSFVASKVSANVMGGFSMYVTLFLALSLSLNLLIPLRNKCSKFPKNVKLSARFVRA